MALRPKLAFAIACLFAALVTRAGIAQHITLDGRFSPAQTLIGPNYAITAMRSPRSTIAGLHSFTRSPRRSAAHRNMFGLRRRSPHSGAPDRSIDAYNHCRRGRRGGDLVGDRNAARGAS